MNASHALSFVGLEANQSFIWLAILVYGRIATTWLAIRVAIANMATAARFSPLVGRINAIAKQITEINEIEKLMMFFILF